MRNVHKEKQSEIVELWTWLLQLCNVFVIKYKVAALDSVVYKVINVCEETSLPCSQRFLDVFNDTALIRFPPHKLRKLPESIWDEPSEPQYEHCQELEIIQSKDQNKDNTCA